MFETLLSLPLFQGLGKADLTRILESTRIEFHTLKAGSRFVQQDEVCTGLTFIIDGRVEMETFAADRSWSVVEEAAVPSVIGTEVLYGHTRTHRHNFTALTPTRILHIDKRTTAALTEYFEVFRLNLLNMLTTIIVRRDQMHWLPPTKTLDERLVSFFRAHIIRPAGSKRFHISLPLLGAYLGEDPRYVSKALHRMQDKGLLTLSRRLIEIPTFEKLMHNS